MVDPSSQPPSFTPINPNPYIVGNPVRNPAMFFGREAEFELVRKRFSQSEVGLLLVFCGERRSGKTSILFQIMAGRLGAGFVPVLIDMQSMAVESEVAFLVRISEEIRRQLNGNGGTAVETPDFSTGGKPSAVFHAFIERVLSTHPGRKLLLMFDEYELLETKIDAKIITEDVLHVLGSLMESHPVFILFTGSHELEKRRRDYWRAFLPKSDFRAISYLQREDALGLITQPVAGRVHYEPGIVDAIHRMTSGQPFYTQAICQRLVDYLNDHRSSVVTVAVLSEVTQDIVDNPLPQMIFLWDGFEAEEKVVLSLLAEVLNDSDRFAAANDLATAVSAAKYPLRTPVPRMAAALDQLFKSEFLLKDHATPPRYAFRMDLWRLWVKRMHSIWQVMREVKAVPGTPSRRRRGRLMAGTAAAAVLMGVGIWRLIPPDSDPLPALAKVESSQLTVVARPEEASIFIDDDAVGQGMVTKQVAADRNHAVRVAAAGYADCTLTAETIQIPALAHTIALRPLLGELKIESDPPGAQVLIDGVPRGTTPLHVLDLPVPAKHRVVLRHQEREAVNDEVQVSAERVTTKRYPLQQLTGELTVSSVPSGAAIEMDGKMVGPTPVTLRPVGVGKHKLRMRLDGYLSADSLFDVGPGTHYWHQTLSPVPPGILVVLGDLPARIFIDDKLVAANVLNSGKQSYSPGRHEIRAELVDGSQLTESVEIHPGEIVTFDYSQRRVVSRVTGERP